MVLRYSGTEPLARVMVEAEREDDVRRWTDSAGGGVAHCHRRIDTGEATWRFRHICKKPHLRRTNTETIEKAKSRRDAGATGLVLRLLPNHFRVAGTFSRLATF